MEANGEWGDMSLNPALFQHNAMYHFIFLRYDMDCNVNETYEDAAWGELHALCEGQNGF